MQPHTTANPRRATAPEFGIYYQLSPEGDHASGNEAAPPPKPQKAPQYPARDCPQECPGGVVS